MRRIPGFDGWNGCRSVDVGVPDHGCPLGTRRPVLASAVVRAIERRTIRLRSRENVVPVRLFSVAVDRLTLFGQRRSLLILLPLCSSVRSFAITTPLEFFQGPLPMRSRAFTAGAPSAACVDRYACQVLAPAPAACASVWQ